MQPELEAQSPVTREMAVEAAKRTRDDWHPREHGGDRPGEGSTPFEECEARSCIMAGYILSGRGADDSGWRPIETAPKDEAVVIYHRLWEPAVRVGRYRADSPPSDWITYEGQSGLYVCGIPPSHWQPHPLGIVASGKGADDA